MSPGDRLAHAHTFRGAVAFHAPWTGWVQIAAVAAFLAIGVMWAYLAVLDEVATGEGRVVPSSRLQVVQTLEGGIVRDILVREGDIVEKDQLLFQIDDTEFAARLGELKQKRLALEAQIARLKAEATGTDMAAAPILASQVGALDAEHDAFVARRTKFLHDKAILESQLSQRQQELREFEARREKLTTSAELLRREVDATRQLSETGAVPELELLRLERQLVEAEGEIAILDAAIPKARAAITEAREKVAFARSRMQSDAREDLAKRLAELAVVEETLRSAEDRVKRTSVRAPVRGIVKRLGVTTIGAVAQSGFELAEIVPLDDKLLVEVRIGPRDVAFVRPGQEARIKLTAFDYLLYGPLEGTVERVSADSFVDDRDQVFYRAIVRAKQNVVEKNGESHPVLPGMVASIDILTGRKSVLEYLMSPILRARDESMRER